VGVWAPKFLNDDPLWYDDRGVNSMQIMAWLAFAYDITGNALFEQSLKDLIIQYNYDVNIITLKITNPDDDNYSDDELTFLPYYTYLLSNSKTLGMAFDLGIENTFNIVKKGKSSLWITIYAAFLQHKFAENPHYQPTLDLNFEDAIYTLQNWPLSWIDWQIDNSERLDVFWDPELSRNYTPDLLTFLPWDEKYMFRWNSDPYRPGPAGSSHNEFDPSAWLLPYWMARYYKLIV